MDLNSTAFYILLSLAEKPLHGADIRRRIEAITSRGLTLYPAMLYGTLDDLQEDGLICEAKEGEGRPVGESARRRYYRITPKGRVALEAAADRLEAMVRLARSAVRDVKPA